MSKMFAHVLIRSHLLITAEHLAATKQKAARRSAGETCCVILGLSLGVVEEGMLVAPRSTSQEGVRIKPRRPGDRMSNFRLVHGTSDGYHVLIYTVLHVNVIIRFPVLSLCHITNSYIQFREEKCFAVIKELGLQIFSRMVY